MMHCSVTDIYLSKELMIIAKREASWMAGLDAEAVLADYEDAKVDVT